MAKKTPSRQKAVSRGLVKSGKGWKKANQKASKSMVRGSVRYRTQKAVRGGRVSIGKGGSRRANQRQNAVKK